MTFSKLLFSCQGRIPRSKLLLNFIIPAIVLSVIVNFLDGILMVASPETPMFMFSILFALLISYPLIAVMAKRCHDRDRSGWFLLVGLVPFLNLWLIIEIYFLKGTKGTNRYGEDPLAP